MLTWHWLLFSLQKSNSLSIGFYFLDSSETEVAVYIHMWILFMHQVYLATYFLNLIWMFTILLPMISHRKWLVYYPSINIPSKPNPLISTDTTRRPRDGEENGVEYFFSMRDEMEQDIKQNKFLEYGEFGGNLYGTTYESIRLCNKSGRMCVLDVNPQVSCLHTKFLMT